MQNKKNCITLFYMPYTTTAKIIPPLGVMLRRYANIIKLKHVNFMLYFLNAGKSFIENNTNSTECAINQHNHGIT